MKKLLVVLSVLLSTQIYSQTIDTTIVLDDVVI